MLMLLGAFCLFSDQVSITPYESEREEGSKIRDLLFAPSKSFFSAGLSGITFILLLLIGYSYSPENLRKLVNPSVRRF